MKGMQKIKRGTGFRGVLNYVLDGGQLIGGNMSGDRAVNLAREFGVTRRLRPDIEKPVWHNSLRLPKGERLPAAKWVEIADDYMEQMGFGLEHMRSYVLHDDEDGQHIHIIASRVSIGSKVYLGRNENLKSTRIISELEQKYGLIQTPTVEQKNDKSRLSRNELAMSERKGVVAPKELLQTILDDLLGQPIDAYDFIRELANRGVAARPNVAKTGRMNGFSFEVDGIAFKASQIGKKYGWPRLKEHVLYDVEQHAQGLQEYVTSGYDVSVLDKAVNNEEVRAIEAASTAIRERNDALRTAVSTTEQRILSQRERAKQLRARIDAARAEQQRLDAAFTNTQSTFISFTERIRVFIEQLKKRIGVILVKQRQSKAAYEQHKVVILSSVNAQLSLLAEDVIYCDAVRKDPLGFVRLALAQQNNSFLDADDYVLRLFLADYNEQLMTEVDDIQREHEQRLTALERTEYLHNMQLFTRACNFDADVELLEQSLQQQHFERDV